jgi:hypothetical protein
LRGSSLSQKSIIKVLRPCIVTSWTGKSTRTAPPEIKAVYRQLKKEYRFNIVLFVLDPDGKVVDAFLPFRETGGRMKGTQIVQAGSWLRDRIAGALKKTKVHSRASAKEKINAPDIDDLGLEEGIRLTILFDPERGGNYKMPTVEVVPFLASEKKVLSRAKSGREFDASKLQGWLEQVFPPGIMNSTGKMKRVSGKLILSPAGRRNSILRGEVTFQYDDEAGTIYKGTLELVISHSERVGVKGILEGMYPKKDRRHHDTNEIGMTVLIESRPE